VQELQLQPSSPAVSLAAAEKFKRLRSICLEVGSCKPDAIVALLEPFVDGCPELKEARVVYGGPNGTLKWLRQQRLLETPNVRRWSSRIRFAVRVPQVSNKKICRLSWPDDND